MYKRHLNATAYEDVPDYNTITVSLNQPKAWEKVSALIHELLETGYEVETYLEGGVTYVINYNYSSELGYGNDVLAWVSPEEQEALADGRYHEVQAETVAPQAVCVPCGSDFAVKDEPKN